MIHYKFTWSYAYIFFLYLLLCTLLFLVLAAGLRSAFIYALVHVYVETVMRTSSHVYDMCITGGEDAVGPKAHHSSFDDEQLM